MTGRKPHIGFIGIGIMGAPMVLHLLELDYEVSCWNREPERADQVVPQGAQWLDHPRAVREAADVVILCVLGEEAVESVCFGDQGMTAAQDGADLVIDCSTLDPDRTRELAQRLAEEAGMSWVDAPVSGGPKLARDGKTIILAGGADEAFARARPILEDLSANLTHFGALGSGQSAKVVNQAIVGVNYVLMAEALVLAERAGIDPGMLPDALAGGAADSRILQTVFRQMQKQDYGKPNAYARQLDKDLHSVVAVAEKLGLDLPLLSAAVQRYAQFVAAGNETKDSASIGWFYQKH